VAESFMGRLFNRVLDAAFANAIPFHALRAPAYLGTKPRIVEALALKRGERLLDIGCGTGFAASLGDGLYLGLDTFVPYLRYAKGRAPRPSVHYVRMIGSALACRGDSFDKAVVINLVHHLAADDIDRLMLELRRVVSGAVLVVDADPEAANPLERFLLDHDRGDYVRNRAELRAILERHYRVDVEDRFHNAMHTVPQVLFRLTPD